MATFTKLTTGSRGGEVRRLQTRLNARGADLAVDGVFGAATRDAVKKYQSANGLLPDGVVGDKTWGRLLEGTPATLPGAPARGTGDTTQPVGPGLSVQTASGGGQVSRHTADALSAFESGYTPSASVTEAEQAWQAVRAGGPGDYTSPYAAELEELSGRMAGRDPFSYDLENDPLYWQYRDQYLNLGRRAMADTMGRAAGLTGGYSSSYGQNVGQQAYDEYLQQLNGKVPELYSLALDRYNAEGDELERQYRRLSDAEAAAYARWRDAVGDYNDAEAAAYRRYADERDADYGRWSDMLDYWRRRANDESDAWWKQTQWDYQLGRDAVADQQWERQFALRAAGKSGSSSGGSSRSSSRGGSSGSGKNAADSAASHTGSYTGPVVHVPPYGYVPAHVARDMVARGELEWVMKDDHRTPLTDAEGNPIARARKSPYHGSFTALN